MIPREELMREGEKFFERRKESKWIKNAAEYGRHCHRTAQTAAYMWGELVYDNYANVISKLLDPTRVLKKPYNLKEEFTNGLYIAGLNHDIGDALLCDELQVLATHNGKRALETYGFPPDVCGAAGSSWVAKEELEVAQEHIFEEADNLSDRWERVAPWAMSLKPEDYVQNSVQELIVTRADITTDLDGDYEAEIDDYIKRRKDWEHTLLVEAAHRGRDRLRDLHHKANDLINGDLSSNEVEGIGVLPIA